jgi:pyruvate dehydrogenase E1 component alpha subunit
MKNNPNTGLGDLANPLSCQESLNIDSISSEVLINFFNKILEIRLVEQKIADKRRDGFIGGPVHLGVGQEAIAVGISSALTKDDYVFGAHRSHAHLLALGSSIYKLFAEVLGRATGLSRGMGGSMHLLDQSCGFYGSVPIVAGTVPLAVGAGLAAKLRNSDAVSVAYLGDGAVEEGVVHESFNLARMLDSPTIFVVENNLFASHMHISLRQPDDSTARFAKANSIPYRIVDGNDVVSVSQAAHDLIKTARSGGGPGFIEAVTYRWYGHVDWREDIDVGVDRSTEQLKNWRARDPLLRLSSALISKGVLTEVDIEQIRSEIETQINLDWEKAMNDPFPAADDLINHVYK